MKIAHIHFGVFSGLYSMVKYILIATKALENLDKGRNERTDAENERQKRRERWKNAGQDE